MAHWHTCNILKVEAGARHLWQFDARNGEFKLSRRLSAPAGSETPTVGTNRTWRSLWQPKLNVALLPSESIFLRVAHLPKASAAETVSMVELQLEKLSPIPVAQLVWSAHILASPAGKPGLAQGQKVIASLEEAGPDVSSGSPPPLPGEEKAEDLQTVVVVLAERKVVEEFLGQLEGDGFLADRLEVPALDQVQATAIDGNGAWIYPGLLGGPTTALVAWWYGGILRDLNLLTLAAADATSAVKEQLDQMIWAGELAGWLTEPPAWNLVADDAMAAEWIGPLGEALGDTITMDAPVQADVLAALTARRAAAADPKVNLLPQEFLTRYQQQFVDRLWMRGLFAIGAVYMVGVAIYFLALGVQNFRVGRVDARIRELGPQYTNSIRIKEEHRVLKDRQELKFAALNCWKSAAELMPETAQLDALDFSDGRKLSLKGTAPKEDVQPTLDFSIALRKAAVDGRPLFGPGGEQFKYTGTPGGQGIGWSFSLELVQSEVK